MKAFIQILLLTTGLALQLQGQFFRDDFFVAEKQTIKSEILDTEKLLFVYLPDGYYDDITRSFPVHYIAEGPLQSNLYFDLLRLHNLRNTMPEGIVVGLAGDNRNENLFPGRGAEKYLAFFKREVIPFIEKNYRTQSFRVLCGHSLGGDFTLFAMLREPSLFNAYIAGSPGPLNALIPWMDSIDVDLIPQDYRFCYTSMGSEEQAAIPAFENISGKLQTATGDRVDCHTEIHQGEDHISNIVINQQSALVELFSDWKFELPEQPDRPVSELLIAHCDRNEEKFGFRPGVSEWGVLFPLMDQLAKRGDFKDAIDILEYTVEIHPDSDQAWAFLARAHFDTGQMEAGKKYLQKALEINPENPFALEMKRILENR